LFCLDNTEMDFVYIEGFIFKKKSLTVNNSIEKTFADHFEKYI
jgi:hypothetical protein